MEERGQSIGKKTRNEKSWYVGCREGKGGVYAGEGEVSDRAIQRIQLTSFSTI
jgi:hypothetical protein